LVFCLAPHVDVPLWWLTEGLKGSLGGTTDQEMLILSAVFHALGSKPPGMGGLDWIERHFGETKSRKRIASWMENHRKPTRPDPPRPPASFSKPVWIAMLGLATSGSHTVRSLL